MIGDEAGVDGRIPGLCGKDDQIWQRLRDPLPEGVLLWQRDTLLPFAASDHGVHPGKRGPAPKHGGDRRPPGGLPRHLLPERQADGGKGAAGKIPPGGEPQNGHREGLPPGPQNLRGLLPVRPKIPLPAAF